MIVEYRVEYLRRVRTSERQQETLNEAAKGGWRLLAVDEGWAYFERIRLPEKQLPGKVLR